jgi:hypothetical protein
LKSGASNYEEWFLGGRLTMKNHPQSTDGSDVISRFMGELVNLVKMLEMYTEKHQLSKEASKKCHAVLKEFMSWRKDVHIIFNEKDLLINGKPLRETEVTKSPSFDRFKSILREKKVLSLTFDRFVTEYELTYLAKLLATSVASPFETRDVATFLREESIFSIRVNEAPGTVTSETVESLLLTHFVEGSLGLDLSEELRERLFNEFKEYSESGARQVLEQLITESSYSYPIVQRDMLTTLGEKWIHFTGEIIKAILADAAFESFDERIVQLLDIFLPAVWSIPEERFGVAEAKLLREMSDTEQEDKIHRYEKHFQILNKRLETSQPFFNRVRNWVGNIVENGNKESFNIQSSLEEYKIFTSQLLRSPSLCEKVFSAIFQLSEQMFIHDLLSYTMDGLTKMTDPSPEITAAIQTRLIEQCAINSDACRFLMIPLVQSMASASSDNVSQSFFEVIIRNIEHLYSRNKELSELPVIEVTVSIIEKDIADTSRFCKLIEVWRDAALSLFEKDIKVFRRHVVQSVTYPLNPGDYSNPVKKKAISDAWKSFSDLKLFQETFKVMIGDDREVRFKTMRRLSRYGTFAVWVCLGALNSQNWHLRRNLATVLGMAVDLNHTAPLLEPLRDHDWRVRLEIINALAERLSEIKEMIQEDQEHPVVKIICTSLRDGNPNIRQAAYRPIETYKLQPAVKSLKNLYDRLSAVNADNDVEERSQIIRLLAKLASGPRANVENIIELIAEIASQKEGLITPNWMIPLKKAAAESLASIRHPLSVEWLEKLATTKPHKRGVIGREARFYLREIENL